MRVNEQIPLPRGRRFGDWLLGLSVFVAVVSGTFLVLGMTVLNNAERPVQWLGLSVGGLVAGALLAFIIMMSKSRWRSSALPAFLSLLCAFFLTGGAFLGFVDSTCGWESKPRESAKYFEIATVVSATLFVLALVWFLITLIVKFARAQKEQ